MNSRKDIDYRVEVSDYLRTLFDVVHAEAVHISLLECRCLRSRLCPCLELVHATLALVVEIQKVIYRQADKLTERASVRVSGRRAAESDRATFRDSHSEASK